MLLRNFSKRLGAGLILWHDLSNGKRTRYFVLDLREIGIDGANWIQLAQERVQWQAFVNTVILNLQVP
jgi:hypothetical protein